MKIIKQGKAWSKHVDCKGCTAALEIEESDIQYEVTAADAARQQYDEEIEGTFYIECPECWQKLIIKNKDIPKPMTIRIKEKQ
jgi:DNA-directed RNA polymerase subunit RPC12/RpoP